MCKVYGFWTQQKIMQRSSTQEIHNVQEEGWTNHQFQKICKSTKEVLKCLISTSFVRHTSSSQPSATHPILSQQVASTHPSSSQPAVTTPSQPTMPCRASASASASASESASGFAVVGMN
ncbi:hypothetical protein ACSBR1_032552 [Camellia fascicularis]